MLSARCEENQECSNNIWSENTNKYLVDGYFMRDEPSLTSSVTQLKLYMQKKGGGVTKKKKNKNQISKGLEMSVGGNKENWNKVQGKKLIWGWWVKKKFFYKEFHKVSTSM